MKDLLVYVADADALAFMRSMLRRHQALGIRSISFDIERHPQRDAGMVQSGAELARMKKGYYGKALLMWDHHGSGRDHRQGPHQVAGDIQGKLDTYTWSGNSAVVVLVPELEQWLWYCESAVATHCGVTTVELEQWIAVRAQKLNSSADALKQKQPKELFEYVMREKLRRTISPRDFEEIGKRAGVAGLLACDSFRSIADTFRLWFPPDTAAC
jgi:hypothetical protein